MQHTFLSMVTGKIYGKSLIDLKEFYLKCVSQVTVISESKWIINKNIREFYYELFNYLY